MNIPLGGANSLINGNVNNREYNWIEQKWQINNIITNREGIEKNDNEFKEKLMVGKIFFWFWIYWKNN